MVKKFNLGDLNMIWFSLNTAPKNGDTILVNNKTENLNDNRFVKSQFLVTAFFGEGVGDDSRILGWRCPRTFELIPFSRHAEWRWPPDLC
jgi:hypothetical protein